MDHRQWHLWYDILENKKFDVKKIAENIERVYYCNKFDPFQMLGLKGSGYAPMFRIFFYLLLMNQARLVLGSS